MVESQFHRYPDLTVSYHDAILVDKPPLSHYHDGYELAFFLHADCRMFVKDRSYHLQDGDMMVTEAYELHNVFYEQNARHSRYVVNFSRAYLEPCLTTLHITGVLDSLTSIPNRKVHPPLKDRMDVCELLRKIHRLHGHGSQHLSAFSEASLKMTLIELLLVYYQLATAAQTEKSTRSPVDPVQAIISYIDANYASTITLEQLENTFHVSRYHLCRLFKQTTGFSVVEYVQFRRIMEAQSLLLTTKQTITEIGLACGFNSSQSFCRVFKNVVGTTATQYRASYG